ncbi:MAG: glycosyltransferase [Chitinophagales bacterium]|jgi:cellulose synthase/poly-beta-1,6-N-acetylglucosamine synthase-like glycosyltransferase|nr:glycosyltransferase [Chitinophagales bacterium]
MSFFIIFSLLLIIIHGLYPKILSLFSKDFSFLPEDYSTKSIAIIIPCHNEAASIKSTLDHLSHSILNEDYSVYLGLDDCQDNTLSLILLWLEAHPEKKEKFIFKTYQRHGKARILNALIKDFKILERYEVLVFLDANIIVKQDTIIHLTSPIGREKISGVGAIISPRNIEKGIESIYIDYENDVKVHESLIHSSIGLHGAIYAVESIYFDFFPEGIICDDLFQSMNLLFKGRRVIVNSKSQVSEYIVEDLSAQFYRKARIANGSFQFLFSYFLPILNLKPRKLLLFFVLHKLMRWMIPFMFFSWIFYFLAHLVRFQNIIEEVLQSSVLNIYGMYFSDLFQGDFTFFVAKIIFLFFVISLFLISIWRFITKFKIIKKIVSLITFNLGFLLGFCQFLFRKDDSLWMRTKRDNNN